MKIKIEIPNGTKGELVEIYDPAMLPLNFVLIIQDTEYAPTDKIAIKEKSSICPFLYYKDEMGNIPKSKVVTRWNNAVARAFPEDGQHLGYEILDEYDIILPTGKTIHVKLVKDQIKISLNNGNDARLVIKNNQPECVLYQGENYYPHEQIPGHEKIEAKPFVGMPAWATYEDKHPDLSDDPNTPIMCIPYDPNAPTQGEYKIMNDMVKIWNDKIRIHIKKRENELLGY